MYNFDAELSSIYDVVGESFVFNTSTIKLIKDDSFEVDNSHQVVYRAMTSSVIDVVNGSILTTPSGGEVKVISKSVYGDYDEEQLLTFIKVW